MASEGGNFRVGNVTGTGIAIGSGASANVVMNQQTQKELTDLLTVLREQVQKAEIPEGAKTVLLQRAMPEMETAARSADPKPAFERGLERINDQLEGAGTTAKNVQGIVDTVAKIASTVGIAVKVVAPFVAGLL